MIDRRNLLRTLRLRELRAVAQRVLGEAVDDKPRDEIVSRLTAYPGATSEIVAELEGRAVSRVAAEVYIRGDRLDEGQARSCLAGDYLSLRDWTPWARRLVAELQQLALYLDSRSCRLIWQIGPVATDDELDELGEKFGVRIDGDVARLFSELSGDFYFVWSLPDPHAPHARPNAIEVASLDERVVSAMRGRLSWAVPALLDEEVEDYVEEDETRVLPLFESDSGDAYGVLIDDERLSSVHYWSHEGCQVHLAKLAPDLSTFLGTWQYACWLAAESTTFHSWQFGPDGRAVSVVSSQSLGPDNPQVPLVRKLLGWNR